MEALVEIEIAGVWAGKPRKFNAWRLAIADMTGVPVRYVAQARSVSLRADAPGAGAPEKLTFIEAETTDPPWAARLTAPVRRGDWDVDPEDPLWIPLLLTVPGGTFRRRHLAGIAERLREMTELIYELDDGRWGVGDIGRRNEQLAARFGEAALRGEDLAIDGGYEPSGWWSNLSRQLP